MTEYAPIKRRVLCLDGGGIKGAFSAAVLAELEAMTGKRVIDHFDLIAGTSTGGIIALALALGRPAAVVRDLYVAEGGKIFGSTGVPGRIGLFRAKHRVDNLQEALKRVLGDALLGDAKTRLVIPSYDADSGDVHVFKTAHQERIRQDPRRPAVEVALATAAAPIYFPAFRSATGKAFLDGGLWANCPVVVALLEASCVLGWPLDRVDVLSIGTTSEPFHVPERLFDGGFLRWSWGGRVAALLLQAQQQAALAQAKLLGGASVYRVDQNAAPRRFRLDGHRQLRELASLGDYAARHHAGAIGERFLRHPVEPFVPCSGADERPE